MGNSVLDDMVARNDARQQTASYCLFEKICIFPIPSYCLFEKISIFPFFSPFSPLYSRRQDPVAAKKKESISS
jgi:hypothetical protein